MNSNLNQENWNKENKNQKNNSIYLRMNWVRKDEAENLLCANPFNWDILKIE